MKYYEVTTGIYAEYAYSKGLVQGVPELKMLENHAILAIVIFNESTKGLYINTSRRFIG